MVREEMVNSADWVLELQNGKRIDWIYNIVVEAYMELRGVL